MDTAGDTSDLGPAVWETKSGWVALGVTELVAGFLAFLVPGISSVPTPALVALLLGLCGIARLAHAYELRHQARSFGELLLGLLYLAAAGAIAARPDIGLPDFTATVGAWCLAVGLMGAVTAARAPRLPSWGWMFGTSLGRAVLGGLLLVGWAEHALVTVALVTATTLLLGGVGTFIVGTGMRHRADQVAVTERGQS